MKAASSNVEFVGRSSLRVTLLSRLLGSPFTPSQLATIESKHVSHVSRALTELKMRGLVESSDSGSRETYYRVTRQGYAAMLALLRSGK